MEKTPILIIDDRKENLSALEAVLKSPELQIVCVQSGGEALAKIKEYRFALVLLDTHISGMDGYKTAELLRSSEPARSIPIIFLTAARMEEHLFTGYDLGAVDYLLKPPEPHILKCKVNVFLELHHLKRQLEDISRQLDAKALELEVLQQELEEKNEKIELLSSLDGLTGLFNRYYFDENLRKEWKQAVREETAFSLLLADIDYLRDFNDCYGYSEGDECLRRVARALHESLLRPVDIIARYGGEEFAAILPNTESDGAEKVARRMLANVAQLEIPHRGSAHQHVTVSIGIATITPKKGLKIESFLDLADRALCRAKDDGRNAVRVGNR